MSKLLTGTVYISQHCNLLRRQTGKINSRTYLFKRWVDNSWRWGVWRSQWLPGQVCVCVCAECVWSVCIRSFLNDKAMTAGGQGKRPNFHFLLVKVHRQATGQLSNRHIVTLPTHDTDTQITQTYKYRHTTNTDSQILTHNKHKHTNTDIQLTQTHKY